jgi:hypothetical protein
MPIICLGRTAAMLRSLEGDADSWYETIRFRTSYHLMRFSVLKYEVHTAETTFGSTISGTPPTQWC